jgi:hypothetical protein
MTDTSTTTTDTGTAPGEGAAPAASPAPAPQATGTDVDATASATSDPFADLPEGQSVYDRGWVDKLRKEGQRYRETARSVEAELQPFRDVFSAYDEADRDVWLGLARTWAQDPNTAAAQMQQIAQAVLGTSEPDPTVTPDAAAAMDEPGELDGLSPEKIEQIVNDRVAEALAARDRAAAENAALEGVYAELRQAGIDPSTREGFMVLWTANHETDGDIGKAIESVTAWKQGVVDEFVQTRRSGALPTPSGGVVANEQPTIKNVEDARRATEAFLRSRAEDSPGQ